MKSTREDKRAIIAPGPPTRPGGQRSPPTLPRDSRRKYSVFTRLQFLPGHHTRAFAASEIEYNNTKELKNVRGAYFARLDCEKGRHAVARSAFRLRSRKYVTSPLCKTIASNTQDIISVVAVGSQTNYKFRPLRISRRRFLRGKSPKAPRPTKSYFGIDESVLLPRKSIPRQNRVSREPGGRSGLTTILEPRNPPTPVPMTSPTSSRGSTLPIR